MFSILIYKIFRISIEIDKMIIPNVATRKIHVFIKKAEDDSRSAGKSRKQYVLIIHMDFEITGKIRNVFLDREKFIFQGNELEAK